MLIINADDWGGNEFITSRILECLERGAIDSVSAMVFMSDSERAARIAREWKIDSGLHLNFTEPFSGNRVSAHLRRSQERIRSWLKSSRIAQAIYNPFLRRDFAYVFECQYQEYVYLYQRKPSRIDGHNHMHICANMFFDNLIPKGTQVRRNITFTDDQKKSGFNKFIRKRVDSILEKRFVCTDYFFHIRQIAPEMPEANEVVLEKIMELATHSDLELLVHPGQQVDFEFLTCDEFLWRVMQVPRCSFAELYAHIKPAEIAKGFFE